MTRHAAPRVDEAQLAKYATIAEHNGKYGNAMQAYWLRYGEDMIADLRDARAEIQRLQEGVSA